MALEAAPGIYFVFQPGSGTLDYYDLPESKELRGQQYQATCVLAGSSFRFSDCTFGDVLVDGSISLHGCRAKSIRAAKNVLLEKTSAEMVVAEGDIAVRDCRDVRVIEAKGKVFLANPSSLRGAPIVRASHIHLMVPLLDAGRELVFSKGNIFEKGLEVDAQIASIVLDGSTCRGDVIFRSDSVIPESQRRVILRHGGVLQGKVIGGQLIDQNASAKAGSSVEICHHK